MSSQLTIGILIGASVGAAISGINRVGRSLAVLRDQTQSTTQKFTHFGKITALGAGALTSGLTATVASLKTISGPAIEFESAMADVKKVVNFDSPKQFKEMSQDILHLTRVIPMAGEEMAAIVAAGGQAGIARENLLGFAQDAAKMGVAFDMSAGEAGEAMATMANVLGKPITEMAKFGDVINHLSDNANAKAAGIVNVIARAGSDTRMLGLSENQAAALGSTFLSMGKAPELAAQAIKGMAASFADLKAGKHAKELKMLGLSPKKFAAAMNKDAQGAITDFIARVKKLPKDQQYPLLSKMFGRQYADDVMLLAQNMEEYNRQLNLLNEKDDSGNFKYVNSMQREFENRSATTANHLQLLQNSFTEIGITIGNAFLPALNRIVNAIKPVVYQVMSFLQTRPWLMDWLVTIGSGLVSMVGSMLLLGTASSALVSAFLGIKAVLGGVWKVLSIASPLLIKMVTGALSLASALSGILVQGLMLAGKAVLFLGRALLMNPIGLIITAIAAAAYLIYRYWEPIKMFFQNLWENVKQIFNQFLAWLAGIWNGVSSWVASAWDGVGNYFSGLWDSIKSCFSSGIGNIASTIANFSPLNLFYQAFSGVLSWFGVDLPANFSDFGQNIIDGLVNGISKTWETAKKKVSELGSSIKNWFAEKLGIHSPSRVFMGFGVNTVEGLAIGINKAASQAIQAVGEVSNQMQAAGSPKNDSGDFLGYPAGSPKNDSGDFLGYPVMPATSSAVPNVIPDPIPSTSGLSKVVSDVAQWVGRVSNYIQTALGIPKNYSSGFPLQGASPSVMPATSGVTQTPIMDDGDPSKGKHAASLSALYSSRGTPKNDSGDFLGTPRGTPKNDSGDFLGTPQQASSANTANTVNQQGVTVYFNPTIHAQGGSVGQIQSALQLGMREFEGLFKRLMADYQRRVY